MHRPLSLALVLATAACSVPRISDGPTPISTPAANLSAAEPVPSAKPVSHSVSYTLWRADVTGLAEVTDDGSRTRIKFVDAPPAGLMLFDEAGKPVSFHRDGESVLVDVVRSGWLFRTPTRSSYAQRPALARTAVPSTAGEQGTLAAVNSKLDALAARLKGLDAHLADSRNHALPNLKSELEAIETDLEGTRATLFRSHFPSGSARLELSEEAREILLKAAQQAVAVGVRGGTDSTGSAELNERLALERATGVKQMFVDGGIEADRIAVGTYSNQFIASNASRAGKALNRRVDVTFQSPGGAPIKWVLGSAAEQSERAAVRPPN